jgi:hypothetical protein
MNKFIYQAVLTASNGALVSSRSFVLDLDTRPSSLFGLFGFLDQLLLGFAIVV